MQDRADLVTVGRYVYEAYEDGHDEAEGLPPFLIWDHGGFLALLGHESLLIVPAQYSRLTGWSKLLILIHRLAKKQVLLYNH